MKTELYFMFPLMLFIIQDGNSLRLNVEPTNIELEATENLLVNCSLIGQRPPGLATLNSLKLSRSVLLNKSEYKIVASITSVGGRVNVYDGDADGKGVVSSRGESYLSVQWANPGNELAGSYICEANGLSSSRRPQTYTVFTEITSGGIYQTSDIEKLQASMLEIINRLNEINNLTERISALENDDTISTNLINKLIADFKAVENNVSISTNLINNLIEDHKAIENNVSTSMNRINKLIDDINAFEKNVSISKNLINNLIEDNKDFRKNASISTNLINNLIDKIEALESNVTISTNLINKIIEDNKALDNNVTTSTNLINKLIDENKALESDVILSTSYIFSLQEENEAALKTLFFESAYFNESRYYLLKECAFVTYTSAQVMCAEYGGYIVEIDNDAELSFIRDFLKEKSSYTTVLISGSDEGHEGSWTHARNNNEVKYIKWVSSSVRHEPDGGTRQNCLCLCSFCDWYFADTLCFAYNSAKTFNFLCEIPQPKI